MNRFFNRITIYTMRLLTLLLLLPLWLTGCANLSTFETPRVIVTDVKLRGGRLMAQDFLVTLQVDNPNDYSFELQGVVADVLLNGHPLARGLSNHRISIPAFGSARIPIVATVQTLELLKQVLELGTHQPISYEVKGHMNVARGWSRDIRIPFSQQGTLDFWGFIGNQAIPQPLDDGH